MKIKLKFLPSVVQDLYSRRFQVPQVELNVRPINTVGKESKYNLCIQKVQ